MTLPRFYPEEREHLESIVSDWSPGQAVTPVMPPPKTTPIRFCLCGCGCLSRPEKGFVCGPCKKGDHV